MADGQDVDVYADVLSVNRSAVGYTLDFLRSDPPTPDRPEATLGLQRVARIRCSDAFIESLLQVVTFSRNQETPVSGLAPTRAWTAPGQPSSSLSELTPPGPAG